MLLWGSGRGSTQIFHYLPPGLNPFLTREY